MNIKKSSSEKVTFHCSQCGYQSVKWLGKCPACQAWETFVKEVRIKPDSRSIREKDTPKLFAEINEENSQRITTTLSEFDRILGGGLVEGEIVLIGGEPGVGKSTLLLEVSAQLSAKGKTLYVSAEESPAQVLVRAKRLTADYSKLYILGEDNLEEVFFHIKEQGFKFVVIDSIQVVYCSRYEGAKGSVTQVRGCADYLTQIAKSLGVVIFVVGHVTKDGVIAGPKLLEHIVDCVLYFEGEILSDNRILRAIKNRFGPTGDIAVFEMSSVGLKEVKETGNIFLPHKDSLISGSCVVSVIEGIRPLLVELQALVSRASFGMVRRRSLGFDFNRFSLLIAIIEKRGKISLSSDDVFLNAAGGIKINDPAGDLGAVMSIISSAREKELPLRTVFIGEIGLAGELRRVNNISLRIKEAERAGFKRCVVPEDNVKDITPDIKIRVDGFSSLEEVVAEALK